MLSQTIAECLAVRTAVSPQTSLGAKDSPSDMIDVASVKSSGQNHSQPLDLEDPGTVTVRGVKRRSRNTGSFGATDDRTLECAHSLATEPVVLTLLELAAVGLLFSRQLPTVGRGMKFCILTLTFVQYELF